MQGSGYIACMGLPEREEVHKWTDQELYLARDLILEEVAIRSGAPDLISDDDMAELETIEEARKNDPSRGIPLKEFLVEWHNT